MAGHGEAMGVGTERRQVKGEQMGRGGGGNTVAGLGSL